MAHRIHQSKPEPGRNDKKSPSPRIVANSDSNQTDDTSKQSSVDGFTRSSVDPLDDAMKELLEMCKQFHDELSMDEDDESNAGSSELSSSRKESNSTSNCDSSNTATPLNHSLANSAKRSMERDKKLDDNNKSTCQNSIQALQQKQTQLQTMLDEALDTAKQLDSRSRRRKGLPEDQLNTETSSQDNIVEGEDEYDDELVEFQKIENELRISDLNRQLNVVQEELRMKLYRRLLFNTNVRKKTEPASGVQEIIKQQSSKLNASDSCTEETSPPSSSCSDEVGVSSSVVSNSNSYSNNSKHSPETDGSLKKETSMVETTRSNELVSGAADTTTLTNNDDCNPSHELTGETINQLGEQQNQQLSNADRCYSMTSTPTTPTDSRDSGLSLSGRRSSSTDDSSSSNIYNTPEPSCSNQSILTNHSSMYTSSPAAYSAHYRNSSVNSDLERIEEDEEDMQGFDGASPNHFRTIYEEKIAPILYNNSTATGNQNNHHSVLEGTCISGNTPGLGGGQVAGELDNRLQFPSKNNIKEVSMLNDRRETETLVNPNAEANAQANTVTRQKRQDNNGHQATWSNRPLTLYLPKPNEEIDLVEHIQALGHDLSVLASDLVVDSSSASGYLRKQSSKNQRRWLKKYFRFDRASKTLCYYETELNFTKKKPQPKNCIPFSDIYDVYVDHIRSGIGKKDLKTSSKHLYIFVLSTADRKYSLASHRTETMRAWIDILFTAAQVNEYLE